MREKTPDKKTLRTQTLKKRDEIPTEQRASKSALIESRLNGMPEFAAAETVLLYASFKSEVDTSGLVHLALESGKRVLLPRVAGPELVLHEIKGLEDLEKGAWGIPEPKSLCRQADVNEADVIIVPGVAFDESGGRLGYGKGFYDRLLSRLDRPIPLIALSFEAQMYNNRLPVSGHDVPMDFIITEQRVIEAKADGR